MEPIISRRRFLSTTVVGAAVGLSKYSVRASGGGTAANEAAVGESAAAELPGSVGLETVIDGLGAPLDVAFAPDADRRYVAERDGRIYVHESDGLVDEPILDLRETVETESEQGLLGLALHPDFAENRRLFVRYSAPRRPGTPEDFSHTFVLAEFEATADGGRVPRDSERTILEIPQPNAFHNAGDVAFGPDGYLYVPVGESGYAWSGQDVTENLLGSVLRIDVDERGSQVRQEQAEESDDEAKTPQSDDDDERGVQNYAVPEDNPLVGRDGLDEYYAWGFRNPWRISFDGDDCFVADVGEDDFEEVNLVEKGGNYGWNVREGSHCLADDCPDETDEVVAEGEPFVDPIVEYPHAERADEGDVSGVSVIGGHVYRGSAMPELDGAYVFGDFLADGRLFAATPTDGDDRWSMAVVDIADGRGKLGRLLSFGRDHDGNVYALGTGDDGGGLFRVVPVE